MAGDTLSADTLRTLPLLDILRAGPLTPEQITARLGLSTYPKMRISDLKRRGLVETHVEGGVRGLDETLIALTPLGRSTLPSRREMARTWWDVADAEACA